MGVATFPTFIFLTAVNFIDPAVRQQRQVARSRRSLEVDDVLHLETVCVDRRGVEAGEAGVIETAHANGTGN